MGFLVAAGTEVYNNGMGALFASAATVVSSVWMLATYWVFHAVLHSPFNDMAAAVAFVQCVQAVERVVVALTAVSSFQLPFILCDLGGSLDQLLGTAADVLLSCFCMYLAVPRIRMRGVRWNAAYVAAVVVSTATVACSWVYLHDGAREAKVISPSCASARPLPTVVSGTDTTGMHFTFELGWCWLPSEACWYDGFSQTELNALRAGCAYATALLFALAALVALVSLLRTNGGSFHRVPRVVFARLICLAAFPLCALGVGAASRFTGDDHRGLDGLTAVLLPLCGCWNALVFLVTEGVTFALVRRIWCNDILDEDVENSPGSPTLPGGFGVPNGFTAAIRFLSCDLAVGEVRRRQTFPDVDTLLLRGSSDLPMPTEGHKVRRVLEM